MKKALIRILIGLGAIIGVLALLIYINRQINPSHTEPYVNWVDENTSAPPADGDIKQRIILFGDAGHSSIEPWQASMAKVSQRASIAPEQTAIEIVFVALEEAIAPQQAGRAAAIQNALDRKYVVGIQLKGQARISVHAIAACLGYIFFRRWGQRSLF